MQGATLWTCQVRFETDPGFAFKTDTHAGLPFSE